MRAILLALFLGLAGCASNTVLNLSAVHDETFTLHMTFAEGSGKCSGTAVGIHLLLTAEHCLVEAQSLSLNGEMVAVKKVYLDGHDHALVVVDKTFKTWAAVAGDPGQGAEVFIFGNPGDLKDMYRHGWEAGYLVADNQRWTIYDMNGFFGDSGSGIFDSQGRVVGVISIEHSQAYEDAYMKVMGGLPIAFTSKQWRDANDG